MEILHWLPVLLAALVILVIAVWARSDLRKADEVRKQVEDSLKSWQSDLNAQREGSGDQVWRLLLKRDKAQDIVTRAIRTVWANRDREPDLEALATVLSQGEASQLATARLAPNLMLLSGLAGTVVGALLSVSGLAGVRTEEVAATEFARKASEALGAIAPAFLATLLGILFSFAFALLVNRATKEQSDLLARVQEFILNEVAPKVIPKRVDQGLEGLQLAVEQLAQHLTVLPRVLSENARQLTESVAQASQGIAGALAVAREVTERTAESAVQIGSASRALEVSAATLERTHQDLGQLHQQVISEFAATRERIDSGIEVAVTRLGDATRAHLEGMVANSQAFRDATGDVADRLRTAVDQVSSVAKGIHDLRDTFHAQAEEVWQRVGSRLDDSFRRAEEVFKQYSETVVDVRTTLEQGLNGIREKFQNLLEQLDPRLWPEPEWRNIRTALTTIVPALEQLLQRLEALPEVPQAPRFDEATHQAIASLDRSVISLQEKLQALQGLPGLDRQMEALIKEMRNLTTSLQKRGHGGGDVALPDSPTDGEAGPPRKKGRLPIRLPWPFRK